MMIEHHPVHDRHLQTGTSASEHLPGEEGLEDLFRMFAGEIGALITDRQFHICFEGGLRICPVDQISCPYGDHSFSS
jgi:hypothetical protein